MLFDTASKSSHLKTYGTWSIPTVCSVFDKGYRYGFNGKERDNEINLNGGDYDFEARIYDSRLGRWLSLDPLMRKKAFQTPYCGMANSPILYGDPDGKDEIIRTTTIDKRTGKTTTAEITQSTKYYRVEYKSDNLASNDESIVYEYYNIYHEVIITVNEDGTSTKECTGSVTGKGPVYKRWPQFQWVPYFEGDLTGEGETIRGGKKLTSDEGGVSPTKTSTLNPEISKNIGVLLEVLGLHLPNPTDRTLDLEIQLKSIAEKLKELQDKNKDEHKKKLEEATQNKKVQASILIPVGKGSGIGRDTVFNNPADVKKHNSDPKNKNRQAKPATKKTQ